MWFNQYPYINVNDLNLDYLLKAVRELRYQLENFININTIKYANPIQWNITKQYEANTVVIDANDGTAYLSVKPVPSGVAITNTDYWTPIFTLNLLSANQNLTLRDDGSNVLATFGSVEGDWLIWNATLYRVSQPINVNEAYVVGYNLDRYTVEMFINDYITEVKNFIGDLNDLDTTDKTDIVNAINELVAVIGDLNDLNTTDKTNAVNAINEVYGNVVNVTARVNNFKFINVLDYNLDPTGTTDNAAALQGIIDDAPSSSVLYFPKGSYKFDSGVTINKPISIVGDGRTNSTLESHYNAGALITFDTSVNRIDGVTIRDIGFAWYSGSISNAGSVAISVEGDSNGVMTYFAHGLFMNIWSEGIETFFQCSKITGFEEIGFNFNTFNQIVTTNRGTNPTKFALRFFTGSGTGNMIYGCDLAVSAAAIDYTSQPGGVLTNIGDIIISNVHFAGDNVNTTAISVYGVNARYHNQLVITNCQFDAGIVKAFSINTMDTVTIHDCNLSSQWTYDLVNCENCSVDFGQNTQSKFYLFDTRTGKTSTDFGYVLSVGAQPIHYKFYVYGAISGVGTRHAYIEGIYDANAGHTVIASYVPDTTHMNASVTAAISGGNASVSFSTSYGGANDAPIYATIEVDTRKINSYLTSHE